MTPVVRYLSHPQVVIDPNVPVPDWGLSEIGHERVAHLVEAGWLAGTTQVISSAERKAIETAEPLARALGCEAEVRKRMHENDRSATGFLPPDEFEQVAGTFFAEPARSVRGWGRAVDAQARIVTEVKAVLGRHLTGDVLFVGHGGVGTLLYCHCAGTAISRAYDQKGGGGGNYWTMTPNLEAIHGWRPMEEAPTVTG